MTNSPFSFASSPATPILLLKTKSSPADGYEEFFSAHNYNPAFIPVLEHHFHEPNLRSVRLLFESGALNPGPGRKYGGLIFTSQRAVEGFAKLVDELDDSITSPASHSLPLYTVGPATSRSLTTLRDAHLPHATIHGAETGNGEALAHFILQHYPAFHSSGPSSDTAGNTAAAGGGSNGYGDDAQLPLLFLVGEQRRDIIPKTLMGAEPGRRIGVDELVVYETGVMGSFEREFGEAVGAARGYLDGDADGQGKRAVWVVVFSPTGCDAMVRVLEKQRQRGGQGEEEGGGKRLEGIFVATIGPTTRDHLRKLGFEVDVCAERPSQEGVGEGIERFMDKWRGSSS
ncbi:tetrapyrrole biosynthesis, uroporphyrinogen III synthase [Aspergillus steynii IBT 23096]|uniref:Tetrapyrrole biosynthesis, uroporphyrinogen III synthase n=1 Tax=Aspergillus steynii IBT 23096 TaxID=1392250 RepID=A0A2I2GBD6_9EURO|nr:tetrapyrrole biosynthesis, uroporphyrinogen III synthase [Aspergillus steynii IBT 23096]PLB50184.1 tetrapyrrole biosynthesis, uroporphyrinogen III synthase [Aspergillus steynii IBT 23096]